MIPSAGSITEAKASNLLLFLSSNLDRFLTQISHCIGQNDTVSRRGIYDTLDGEKAGLHCSDFSVVNTCLVFNPCLFKNRLRRTLVKGDPAFQRVVAMLATTSTGSASLSLNPWFSTHVCFSGPSPLSFAIISKTSQSVHSTSAGRGDCCPPRMDRIIGPSIPAAFLRSRNRRVRSYRLGAARQH